MTSKTVAELGADQHQGGIYVREGSDHPCLALDIPVAILFLLSFVQCSKGKSW